MRTEVDNLEAYVISSALEYFLRIEVGNFYADLEVALEYVS